MTEREKTNRRPEDRHRARYRGRAERKVESDKKRHVTEGWKKEKRKG